MGIPYLEKAITIEKDNSYWLEDLAVAYGMIGKYAKTIPLLKKAIELRPNDSDLYNNLATSYSKMGNEAKAEYYIKLGNEKGANK